MASCLNAVGHVVLELREQGGPALGEDLVVLADHGVGAVGVVQVDRQRQAERVDPRGVGVDRRAARVQLDEVVVLAGGRSEVEVDPAGIARGHRVVRRLRDRLGDAVDAPVDLAVGVLAVGGVDEVELDRARRARDAAGVAPEPGREPAVGAAGSTASGGGERQVVDVPAGVVLVHGQGLGAGGQGDRGGDGGPGLVAAGGRGGDVAAQVGAGAVVDVQGVGHRAWARPAAARRCRCRRWRR